MQVYPLAPSKSLVSSSNIFLDHQQSSLIPIARNCFRPVVCSLYVDGYFHKKYSKWKMCYLKFSQNTLEHYENEFDGNYTACFDITRVDLHKIETHAEERMAGGVVIKVVLKLNGLITYLRCLVALEDAQSFSREFMEFSEVHNMEGFSNVITEARRSMKERPAHLFKKEDIASPDFLVIVEDIMEKARVINNCKAIMERRKAFHWLPVYFDNDFVHGSWWWVVGSAFLVVTSAIIIANKSTAIVGSNDDVLPNSHFDILYILQLLVGLLFGIGSLAFVRAMALPRMQPMFRWYHVSTDSLFGSWCFLWGTVPTVPYSLISLAGYHSSIYLLYLIASIIAVLFAAAFVYVNYPGAHDVGNEEKESSHCIEFLGRCCGNFCGMAEFLRRHAETDLLAGAWFVFLGTALGTFVFALITAKYYHESSGVTNFINITTTFDFVFFLIGSAYFVAGSYPLDHSKTAPAPRSNNDSDDACRDSESPHGEMIAIGPV